MSAGEAILKNAVVGMPSNIVAPEITPSIVKKSPELKTPPYAWILNPVVDLLFCCGGLLWIVFCANFLIKSHLPVANTAMLIFTIVGTHILSETHTAATLERLHQSEPTRNALKTFGWLATLACSLLAIVSLYVPAITPISAKLYLVWIVQHFMAQSYGIALIYCYKRNYILSTWEKRVFKFAIDATVVYGIARQFAFKEWSVDKFIGQTIPYWGLVPEPAFAIIDAVLKFAVLAFVGMIGLKFARERKIFPAPAAMLIVTSIAIFTLPKAFTDGLWMYVPAFFHGCQYLVVSTSYFLKERGLPENVSTSQVGTLLFRPTTLKYFATLFVVGIFIYGGVPGVLQDLGFDFKLAFATVFCAINFHHFLIDAAIWKLRDPRVRKLLIA